jgi:emopamil binding protein
MRPVRRIVPLAQRRLDVLFIVFFLVNVGFITYIVDLEQIVISDPEHFTYPLWPPAPLVDLVHSWGHTYDPLQLARPPWWKATIWIDALLFGPFYVVATYAFATGREWIRLPSVIWASVMLTNVTIILSEEIFGPYASPHLPQVLAANAPWLLIPLLLLARMLRSQHPFTSERTEPAALAAVQTARVALH